MHGSYRNLGYILFVFPLIIVAGFWIPYFSQIPTFNASITTAVHIHAFLLFAWVGLVVVQPLAIRNKALLLHRLLGKASYVLMPFIVLFSIAMLGKEYQEKLASGMNVPSARSADYLSTIQVTLFAVFYRLAIVRIRKRDIAGAYAVHDLHCAGPAAGWIGKNARVLVRCEASRLPIRLPCVDRSLPNLSNRL
jgi:hypothetical protein